MLRFASKRFEITKEHRWYAVIDFCAFKWRDIQCVSHALEGLLDKYIFISTDSVYNNSNKDNDSIHENMKKLE